MRLLSFVCCCACGCLLLAHSPASLDSDLMMAAMTGNADQLRMAVAQGGDVNMRDQLASTPLHAAARSGSIEAVQLIAEQGANIYASDGFGWTALMAAAAEGHLPIVRYLQSLGCDIQVRDREGISPFMWACANDRLEVAEFLLEQGVDVNQEDFRGRTALDFSLHSAGESIHQLLVQHNAKHGSSSGQTQYCVRPVPAAPQTPDPIVSLAGQTLDLDDYQGQATLLVFDATWCQSSLATYDALRTMAAEFDAQYFSMIAIFVDDEQDSVRLHQSTTHMPWSVYFDSYGRASEQSFGVDRFPTFVLRDHRGKTITTSKGWSTSAESVITREARKAYRKARKSANR